MRRSDDDTLLTTVLRHPGATPKTKRNTAAAIAAKVRAKAGAAGKYADTADFLALALKAEGIEGWVRERSFHNVRQWRWDISFDPEKLSIEVHGGIRSTAGKKNSHAGGGMKNDLQKLREGQRLGWRVLVFTSEEVLKTPLRVCDEIRAHLEGMRCRVVKASS